MGGEVAISRDIQPAFLLEAEAKEISRDPAETSPHPSATYRDSAASRPSTEGLSQEPAQLSREASLSSHSLARSGRFFSREPSRRALGLAHALGRGGACVLRSARRRGRWYIKAGAEVGGFQLETRAERGGSSGGGNSGEFEIRPEQLSLRGARPPVTSPRYESCGGGKCPQSRPAGEGPA